jgi:hypothetical protein
MPRRVKLGIMRARHDATVPYISDAACIAMFMHNADRRAVFDYWTDLTDGYVDFRGSSLMPWVDVTLNPAATDRNTQLKLAYDATAALPGAVMSGFDGWIVLTLPGRITMAGNPVSIDGGTGNAPDGKAGSAFPVMSSDHTFFCHEVGHVLGFGHTYGVMNNGIEWDGQPPFDEGQVYGDPYDIMSSASYGTRGLNPVVANRWFSSPTFTGPAVAGWPYAAAAQMGCAPARAHVHLWDPAAFRVGTVREVASPTGQGEVTTILTSASRRGPGTHLLIVHSPYEDAAGRGRLYVEYRERNDWDQGLDLSGAALDRQAVVVHSLADAVSDGVRCWYRGRIVVPQEPDTDLEVAGTYFVVRVRDYSHLDEGRVEVGVSLAAPRSVDVEVRNYETLLAETDQQEMGTPCGDTIVSATRTWQTTTHYVPSTRGYGGEGAPNVSSPVVTWTVGGTPVAAGAGSVDFTTAEGSVFTIQYELDPATQVLVLVARGGERYTADVVCTATEADGTGAVSASHGFDPIGWSTGFSAADLAKLDDCMAERFRRLRIRPRDWFVEPEPDPRVGGLRDRINEARARYISRSVRDISPVIADDVARIADMRYQDFR